MPNNKYLRSTKRERELVNAARAGGMIAARSAGSHSPVDVWIFDPRTKELKMIQVKTRKNARMFITKDETVYENVTAIKATYSWQ